MEGNTGVVVRTSVVDLAAVVVGVANVVRGAGAGVEVSTVGLRVIRLTMAV